MPEQGAGKDSRLVMADVIDSFGVPDEEDRDGLCA